MLRIRAALAILAGIALVSCASHTTPGPGSYFLHTNHREAFAFEAAELNDAKFYVTRDLLAKGIAEAAAAPDATPPEGMTNAAQPVGPVVFVTMLDIGHVTGGGPDWLRVSFGSGSGLVFLTDPASGDPTYYLATEVAGRPGFHIVKDLDDPHLLHDGQRLEIDFGAGTGLLIDSQDLQDLMDARMRMWKNEGR